MLTGVRNQIVLSAFPDNDKLRHIRDQHDAIDIVETEEGQVIVTSFVRVSPHQADLCLDLRTASDRQRHDLERLRNDVS